LSTRPAYRERRKELYNKKRQALLDSGFVPGPRGCPRIYSAEEARERQMTSARESARRSRARSRAFKEAPPELN
jgi:hypothetical protein